jgi:hypothetical protein
MITTKSLVRLASVAGVLAVALMSATFFASTAHAQNPPATMYGTTTAAAKVEALIGGRVCQTATADGTGFWQMQIPEGGTCGAADGATINFQLNGAGCAATETWRAGGAPRTVATGVALANCTGAAGGVTPPKTGNAGLLPSGGASSPWFALMLGAFALAGLAGARAMTGRRS